MANQVPQQFLARWEDLMDSAYEVAFLASPCSEKLHLQSYLEMLWSETGCFGLLGNNIILVIILLDIIER